MDGQTDRRILYLPPQANSGNNNNSPLPLVEGLYSLMGNTSHFKDNKASNTFHQGAFSHIVDLWFHLMNPNVFYVPAENNH